MVRLAREGLDAVDHAVGVADRLGKLNPTVHPNGLIAG